MREKNVAIAGATGAVGTEMIKVLEDLNFPVKNLRLLASERSVGKKLKFKNEEIPVEKLDKDSFKNIDIALFSAGASRSLEFAKYAVDAGAVVIDNSSAFRMNDDVPLVVPEVNPEKVKEHKGIIANPNCSTIQMVVALYPIHKVAKIKRIIVSTYQAVSGTGMKAIEELKRQIEQIRNNEKVTCEVYPHQIAYNVLPHVDVFLENGYTKEEMKMVNETRKIMNDYSIQVTATTVRVPVIRAHSESINIELEKKLTANEVREILSKAPGVIVQDEPSKNIYPLAIYATGKYETFVGRIREDISVKNGIAMWVVADQLLKGAAYNAVQIAQLLL
ncbi:MAG TPA: aspartate-semialdehyde dehydrogenase [bacterium]|nr:aspartate-semialdehyde dehydrogenase [bacterium]HPQ19163.1 aspartate-semialdehyde dehydrogenase [bacterium]